MRAFSLVLLLAGCSRGFQGDNKDPLTDSGVVTDSGADSGSDSGADSGSDSGADSGGDSGGDSGTPLTDADGDGFYAEVDDCDDGEVTVHPGAPELCDGLDNDCDGDDESVNDADGDGTSDCNDYCPVYASPLATGDGRSVDPLGSLQDAIDLAGASGCNEARAYPGTYVENLDWSGWPVNAESTDGPAVTVVDGNAAGPVARFDSGEGPASRVYGFTLTNGGGGRGGGVFVYTTSPTIEGNVITGNTVEVLSSSEPGVGGGVYSYNGSPEVVGNEISDNDACYGGPENGCDGGALAIRGGEPLVWGNLLVDNTAGDGGALWLAYSDALILNNVIAGNAAADTDPEAGGQGGGINVQIAGPSGPWIEANIIADNTAQMFGGGIVTYEANDAYGEASIVNNTIAFNTVTDTDYGAGFCQWRRTAPTFMNNIVYANAGVGVYAEDDIDATITYNLVNSNTTAYGGAVTGSGVGNLSGNPRFVAASDDGDWTNDDFHLGAGSPALHTGNPDDAYDDVDGSPNDIGAYGGPYGSW